MKIRKRGGPDCLDLRGRERTGSSMTVPSSVAAWSCDIDPGLVFAIAIASAFAINAELPALSVGSGGDFLIGMPRADATQCPERPRRRGVGVT
jgi:hypothetical protein